MKSLKEGIVVLVVMLTSAGCVFRVPQNYTYHSTIGHRRDLSELVLHQFSNSLPVPIEGLDSSYSAPPSFPGSDGPGMHDPVTTGRIHRSASSTEIKGVDTDLELIGGSTGIEQSQAPLAVEPISPFPTAPAQSSSVGANPRVPVDNRDGADPQNTLVPNSPRAQELYESQNPVLHDTTDAEATQVFSLSIEQARGFALEGNLNLKVQLVDPAIQREQISVEEGTFEATFEGTFQRDRSDGPPGNFSFGPPDTTNDRFSPTFNVPLTTGGTVSISQNFNYQRLNFADTSTYDTNPRVRISQPLLRNAWDQVNTAGIAIAELNTGISESQTKLTAIAVLAQTEKAYWNLWFNRARLRILELQVSIAKSQQKNAKRLADEGVFSRVEELRSLAGVKAREIDVIAAGTNVLISQRDLKRLMQSPDLPVESMTDLVPVTTPEPIGLTFDREKLTEQAMSNRMDLFQLYLQYERQGLTLNVQNNSILPRADLFADSRLLGTSNGSFGSASADAWDGSNPGWLAGISVEVPLWGNVSARARRNQTELSRVGTLISIDQTKLAIRQDIYDAVDRFERSWLGILSALGSVKAAEEALRAEQRLFELGSRTSDLVLLAAANLGNAQIQVASAVLAYQTARVDLALATGTVLGHGHIYWREPYHCHPPAAVRPR